MSFTIVTDVFCDFCIHWMDEGGYVGSKVEKVKSWKKAVGLGWQKQKITGKHMCPRCVVRLANKDGDK